jgi:hypothetical protein
MCEPVAYAPADHYGPEGPKPCVHEGGVCALRARTQGQPPARAIRRLPGMSWPLWTNWVTVIGLLLLSLGTGAQAWTNLTEYQDLFSTVPEATRRAVREQFTDWHLPRRWYLSLGTLSFA